MIPDTTLYCTRLFDLILKPLQDGRVIPPLKIEAAKGRSGQRLLGLLQPHDMLTASGARPDLNAGAPAIEAAPSLGNESRGAIGQNGVGITVTDRLSTLEMEEGEQ